MKASGKNLPVFPEPDSPPDITGFARLARPARIDLNNGWRAPSFGPGTRQTLPGACGIRANECGSDHEQRSAAFLPDPGLPMGTIGGAGRTAFRLFQGRRS